MTQRSRKLPGAEGRAAEETAGEAGGLSPRLLVARRSPPTPSLSISIPSRPILFRCLLGAMSLFQSALDFLAGPGSLGAASRDQNDFVGQTVEMGDMKLRIKRVIAEGKSGRQGRALWGGPRRCGAGMGFPAGLPLPFSSLLFLDREGFLLGRPRPGGGGRAAAGAAVPASREGLAVSVPLRALPLSGHGVPGPGVAAVPGVTARLRNRRREPLGCAAASSLASWFKMPSPHNRAQRSL